MYSHTIDIKKSIVKFQLKNCENTYNPKLRNLDSMVNWIWNHCDRDVYGKEFYCK